MSRNRRGWPYEPVAGAPTAPQSAPPIEGPPSTPPGPDRPAISRRAVVLLSLAGVLALGLASVGIGDWWVRNREMQTLLGRIELAENAQRPAIRIISPLLMLCQRDAGAAAEELCDTVSIRQTAERILPALQATGDDVAATRLTSYHGNVRSFRDRYVDHYLAWRGWLEALAVDPTAGGFRSPEEINTTFEKASGAADEALTPLPLHGNRDRVEEIFAAVR